MKRFVDFLIHDHTVAAVIVINAISLAAMASSPDEHRVASLWFAIDYLCVVFFLVELVLKIRRFGWRGYWAGLWDRFDFFLVATSLPVLLAPAIDLHCLSIVLTLRLGRLFRLFRLLRFVPNGAHMVEGIKRALKASVPVFLALVVINIVLSVGATMFFGSLAPEHFGNPVLSTYSVFKVFTVEGWNEIPDLLAARSDSNVFAVLVRVYFVISVLIGGILGLSLANAVFVDQMIADNNEPLEKKVDELAEEIRNLRSELTAKTQ